MTLQELPPLLASLGHNMHDERDGHSANVLHLFTPKELYFAQLTNEALWAFPPFPAISIYQCGEPEGKMYSASFC